MSLLTIVHDAMAICRQPVPSVVYSSTDPGVKMFRALAQEAGDAHVEEHGWRPNKVLGQLTGDGSETQFSLPADFDRMMPGNPLWQSDWPGQSLRRVTDEQMLAAKLSVVEPLRPVWRMFGNNLEFYPAPDDGTIIKFEYRSRWWISDVDGALRRERWAADDDYSMIPERLIKLSLIWRWKASQGLEYAEDMQNWQVATASYQFGDASHTPITIRRRMLDGGLATGVIGDVPVVVP